MISTRDSGWVQFIAEDCQDILDSVIMSYRLAEDYNIQLPVMLNYDGYYLSYLSESIEIPSQEAVDRFLAPLKDQPQRMTLEPGTARGCGSHGMGQGFVEFRKKHMAAMERVKAKWDEIDAAFEAAFGRSYGGQIEPYRCDDADIVLVASGSAVGTAKTVVDAKREQGIKIGVVKLRLFRPFPAERLSAVLKGKKAVGVLDRSICFGWNCGPLFMELSAITRHIGIMPMLSFIDGLANLDITQDHIGEMIDAIHGASRGESYQEVTWL
jgi:pyruvate/2-oxoacid:ferredoxin oxidoreductase alpha subunit